MPVDVLPEHLLQASGVRLRRDESGALPPDASLFEIVADFERRTIIERLEQCDWSQTEPRGELARSALDAESEDQAAEYRDPEKVGLVSGAGFLAGEPVSRPACLRLGRSRLDSRLAASKGGPTLDRI